MVKYLVGEIKLLDMSHNQINGTLPKRGLRTLWKLQCLNLAANNIVGKINPDVSRLTSLVVLNLSSNQVAASSIPARLCRRAMPSRLVDAPPPHHLLAAMACSRVPHLPFCLPKYPR